MFRQWRLAPLSESRETPPVTNTWYQALPPTSNVLGVYHTYRNWNGVDNEDFEYRWTIDGTTYAGAHPNVARALGYSYVYLDPVADALLDTTDATMMCLGHPLPCQSVTVEYRITTNNGGAARDIWSAVRYMQL